MTPAQSKKKCLLILGSGFSKAISEQMPTVLELVEPLKQLIEQDSALKDLENPRYQTLLSNPELLLTYLAQDQPWKEPWEAAKDQGLYLKVVKWLARHIASCEHRAFIDFRDKFRNKEKEWPVKLAQWLNKTLTPVISFNYDTLLERICYFHVKAETHSPNGQIITQNLDAFNLYRLPLTVITHREAGTGHAPPQTSFQLIKLHGSINWFYSGSTKFAGEQIYYKVIDSESPLNDMVLTFSPLTTPVVDPSKKLFHNEIDRLTSDKDPLIIPPLAEKSRFYSNQTVRLLWDQARKQLAEAEEVYFVGYSLPDTDLTTKLLLQTACMGQSKTIYIVNNDLPNKGKLLRRYSEVFPKGTVKENYIRPDAVEAMVNELCRNEAQC
jgi:hypothetical protein